MAEKNHEKKEETETPEEVFGDDVLTLQDEDGTELRFEILGSAELNGTTYLALYPIDDNENEEYVILKQEADENGEPIYSSVDDEEEFDRVVDYFDDALFDEIDYDADAPQSK